MFKFFSAERHRNDSKSKKNLKLIFKFSIFQVKFTASVFIPYLDILKAFFF